MKSETQDRNVQAEFLKFSCTINNFDYILTFGNADLIHGKWATSPQSVPANAQDFLAFSSEGRSFSLEGTQGTVTYSFDGANGTVTLNLSFTIPYKGSNSFTAGLTGNITGPNGTYKCTYSNTDGNASSGTVTLTFTPSSLN